MDTSRITIVGGSGFIGTRLATLLERTNTEFRILDLKLGKTFPDRTDIKDIRSSKGLAQSLFGDCIIHLAAVHRDDISDNRKYFDTNVLGTKNLCAAASERGIHKIIFTSSVAVYGFAPPNTDESGVINPFNEYGRTKHLAEEALREWLKKDTRNQLTIIRPTVVFGEGNRGNVYNLIDQIESGRFMMVGPGTNFKSMAYVGNIAAFLLETISNNERYQLVNYADGPDISMNELVSLTRKTLTGNASIGLRIPFPLGMMLGYAADLAKKITTLQLPISSVRVKKFCATTSFNSSSNAFKNFEAPLSLNHALVRTIEAEFLSPDQEIEIFDGE